MGIMAGAPMGRDLRNVRQVLCVGGIFLHCHGEERFHDSLQGVVRGITYRLVSGDYLDFKPVKIL